VRVTVVANHLDQGSGDKRFQRTSATAFGPTASPAVNDDTWQTVGFGVPIDETGSS
jgi:hypothetical protein